MAKYIRAVEAAEKVAGTFKVLMADLVDIFAEIPTADVAPVVRCKNCRSYNKPKTGWCEVHLDCEHPDDFCSYGERKESADNG